MFPPKIQTAPFSAAFFPQHIILVTVADNLLPMGYWTVISKDPFRVLICMGVGNYSLGLLKKYKEAALHFMPWSARQQVVAAGYLSGRNVSKAEQLGFSLKPAEKLKHTRLVEGADTIFETVLFMELANISREFVPCVMDVVATHGNLPPTKRQPIFYLSQEDFTTCTETWQYVK